MNHMNQKRINLKNEILLTLIKEECHGRDIAARLDIPLTSVQRALLDLEKDNVLDYKLVGKNKIYRIKKNLIAKTYVYNAENYNVLKTIREYPYLELLFEDIAGQCKSPLIVLFGSHAKFNAKKESDIDIYIETKDMKIKKKIEAINSRLSVKIGSFNKDSLLIKEIIKNHVVIRGIENYYDKIEFFGKVNKRKKDTIS